MLNFTFNISYALFLRYDTKFSTCINTPGSIFRIPITLMERSVIIIIAILIIYVNLEKKNYKYILEGKNQQRVEQA